MNATPTAPSARIPQLLGRWAWVAALALLAVVSAGGCAASAGGSRGWAHESAPALTGQDMAQAQALLLEALDREALYTLVPDPETGRALKPMSSGFASIRIELASPGPGLAELERTRRLLGLMRTGDFYADVMVFAASHEGRRSAEAWVVHRPTLAAMLEERSAFFAPLGLSPTSHPIEVITTVERLPRLERFRAYGYLFGYPDYAVDFFVQAADEGEKSGTLVPRDFVSVPTFESPTNRFVYAVPKGSARRAEDEAIADAAAPVLERYRELRSRWAPEGRTPDAVRLWERLRAAPASARAG